MFPGFLRSGESVANLFYMLKSILCIVFSCFVFMAFGQEKTEQLTEDEMQVKSQQANIATGTDAGKGLKLSFGSLEKRVDAILLASFPNKNLIASKLTAAELANIIDEMEQKGSVDPNLVAELTEYYAIKEVKEEGGLSEEEANKILRRFVRVKKEVGVADVPVVKEEAEVAVESAKESERVVNNSSSNVGVVNDAAELAANKERVAVKKIVQETNNDKVAKEKELTDNPAYLYKGIKDYDKAKLQYMKDHGYIK